MIDDDLLIAFADGECSDADRARVEQALAEDSALRERLEQHRLIAARLNAHFGPIAEAPMPDRLTALLQKQEVIDFATARAAKERRRLSGWGAWGAIAASLAVGVMVGQLALPGRGGGIVDSKNGTLVAQGELAEALDVQLASAQGDEAKVRIGVSFRDQAGQYCRSFEAGTFSGIGCRGASGWALPVTHSSRDFAAGGGYRQAGSGDPLVMQAATAMMRGDALDADTERKARDNGWQ